MSPRETEKHTIVLIDYRDQLNQTCHQKETSLQSPPSFSPLSLMVAKARRYNKELQQNIQFFEERLSNSNISSKFLALTKIII